MNVLINKFFLLSTLVIFLLCSCQDRTEKKTSSANQATSMEDNTVIAVSDTLKAFLVNSTVQDFYKTKQNNAVEFRNVLLKLYETKTYLICGEFLEKNIGQPEKWVDFATLKTEGYELWIGGNATTYCKDAKTISSSTEDLATLLNTHFKKMQKKYSN